MGLELGVSICTNHSLRATAIARMFRSKVPESIIAENSGYRSIAALHSYEHTSCEQEQVAGRAIVTWPAIIDHVNGKKSLMFSVFAVINNYLHYCNKIFITTAEFNGLSSTVYGNGITHSE